jgi:hypothetical protein
MAVSLVFGSLREVGFKGILLSKDIQGAIDTAVEKAKNILLENVLIEKSQMQKRVRLSFEVRDETSRASRSQSKPRPSLLSKGNETVGEFLDRRSTTIPSAQYEDRKSCIKNVALTRIKDKNLDMKHVRLWNHHESLLL